MPLQNRKIENNVAFSNPIIFQNSLPGTSLQDISFSSTAGALAQITLLSIYAHDIFSKTFEEITSVRDRVVKAKEKLEGIQHSMISSNIKQEEQNDGYYEILQELLLQPETISKNLYRRYNTIYEKPDYTALSMALLEGDIPGTTTGADMLRRFSDPSLFFQKWERDQEKRLQAAKEERDKAKAEKKAREEVNSKTGVLRKDSVSLKHKSLKPVVWKDRFEYFGQNSPGPPSPRSPSNDNPNLNSANQNFESTQLEPISGRSEESNRSETKSETKSEEEMKQYNQNDDNSASRIVTNELTSTGSGIPLRSSIRVSVVSISRKNSIALKMSREISASRSLTMRAAQTTRTSLSSLALASPRDDDDDDDDNDDDIEVVEEDLGLKDDELDKDAEDSDDDIEVVEEAVSQSPRSNRSGGDSSGVKLTAEDEDVQRLIMQSSNMHHNQSTTGSDKSTNNEEEEEKARRMIEKMKQLKESSPSHVTPLIKVQESEQQESDSSLHTSHRLQNINTQFDKFKRAVQAASLEPGSDTEAATALKLRRHSAHDLLVARRHSLGARPAPTSPISGINNQSNPRLVLMMKEYGKQDSGTKSPSRRSVEAGEKGRNGGLVFSAADLMKKLESKQSFTISSPSPSPSSPVRKTINKSRTSQVSPVVSPRSLPSAPSPALQPKKLLDQILTGKNLLRQTPVIEKKKHQAELGGFANSAVSGILARRKYLQAEPNSSDSDPESDDDLW